LWDWRGKVAPSLAEIGLEWLTTVPALNGKIILIEFWATWCKKCAETTPLLSEIHRELKDDVIVIAITEENPDKVKKWLQTHTIDYHVAHDAGGKLHTRMGIKGIPNAFVLDNTGRVLWQGLPNPPDKVDVFTKAVLLKLIASTKNPPQAPAKLVPITEDLIFASQPTEDQLKNLQLVGIKSVLNLRTDDEKGFIPNEEKLIDPSIEYTQIPIKYLNDVDESNAALIISTIEQLPKPLLVHCNIGLTACAAILLKVAQDEKQQASGAEPQPPISRHQFLEWGAGLGFNFADQPRFFQFLGKHLEV